MTTNGKIVTAYGKCFQDGDAFGHRVKADFRYCKNK